MEDLNPTAPGSSSRRPTSFLLDDLAYVETTATPTVGACLQISEPPAMSKICVYHPLNSTDTDFYGEPRVIHTEGPFILLRAQFASRRQAEYLVFKGNNRSPSLDRLPRPTGLLPGSMFGIVPHGPDGHYLLAALGYAGHEFDYQLHIYSSEDQTWSTKHMTNPCPRVERVIPAKVIALGEGKLGFVNFQTGMLVCNLFHDLPAARFIPIPNLLPRNSVEVEKSPSWPGCHTRWFRDVIFSNGVVKLVEIEHRTSITKIFRELPSSEDVLYDSDLMARRGTYVSEHEKLCLVDGWRVVTWTRTATSDCWRNRCILDVDDIVADESSLLMPGINSNETQSPGCLRFRNLFSYFPTLSTDGNVVYLQSVEKFGDPDGWVVALDRGSKTLKALGRCSFARHDECKQAFRSCALLEHRNVPSGPEASDFYLITHAACPTQDPNNTKKRTGEPGSYHPKHKCPRLDYPGDKSSLGIRCH